MAGFVTERLTLERVAHLVDCDADSLKPLELQQTRLRDGISPEVEWNEDNIKK